MSTEIPLYISFSGMTTYQKCPQQYKLGRVDKVKESKAYYFAGGSAVHSATEAIDWQLLKEQGVVNE
jgi:ATP-dependent helicase/DNAse subunit B